MFLTASTRNVLLPTTALSFSCIVTSASQYRRCVIVTSSLSLTTVSFPLRGCKQHGLLLAMVVNAYDHEPSASCVFAGRLTVSFEL